MADTLGSLGIDLTEAEFATLLHVCQFDAGWARTEALLRRVGRELITLSTVRDSSPCICAAYTVQFGVCVNVHEYECQSLPR